MITMMMMMGRRRGDRGFLPVLMCERVRRMKSLKHDYIFATAGNVGICTVQTA